jgi:hypothetical protein
MGGKRLSGGDCRVKSNDKNAMNKSNWMQVATMTEPLRRRRGVGSEAMNQSGDRT